MYKIIGGDQKEYGPVSLDQLVGWVRDNRANAQTLVQREGGPWVPLGSLPELAAILPAQPASTPSTSMGPSAAPSGGYPAGPASGAGFPSGLGVGAGDSAVERARKLVQGPATALMVTGILCVVAVVVSAIVNLVNGGSPMQLPPGELPPEARQVLETINSMRIPITIVSTVLGLVVSGLVLLAAQKLRALESFTLVVIATILVMFPCLSPCCCIGLPVGIWVLAVLFKPEVKSVFR